MILNKKTQIMKYTLNQLMSVNLHIGDKTHKWNSLLKNLLFGGRHGVYYFNLKKTFPFLNRFLYFFTRAMESHKLLLFVGQHEFIQVLIDFLMTNTEYFASTEKWVGGTLTNWKLIKKFIYKIFTLTKKQIQLENYLRTDKKIQQKVNRYLQMRSLLYGFRYLPAVPNFVIFFNQQDANQTSFFEAYILSIPVITIVNTSSNPYGVTYPIFSNDNTFESLFFISNLMYNCILTGYYKKRLYFLKNTSFFFNNLLNKKNRSLRKNSLLSHKLELFLLKSKKLQHFKIKRTLRQTFFFFEYKNLCKNIKT